MNRPIGVFDSGVGGLTIVKEIFENLPNETIYFFGDTKNCPYGEKSREELILLAREAIKFFENKGVKLIVLACNTVTSAALELLKKESNIPIIGVIEPCVKSVTKNSNNKNILILGTQFTINSEIYEKEIKEINATLNITSKACNSFVPFIEKGLYINEEDTMQLISKELETISTKNIDAVVLGCTHYPLLENSIKKYINNKVNVISAGKEIVKIIKKHLKSTEELSFHKNSEDILFISKKSDSFNCTAKRLLKDNIKIELI